MLFAGGQGLVCVVCWWTGIGLCCLLVDRDWFVLFAGGQGLVCVVCWWIGIGFSFLTVTGENIGHALVCLCFTILHNFQ